MTQPFMSSDLETSDHHRLQAREVRSQVVWAAISAVLLLYFGWGRGEVINYTSGAAILDWTCKIGGLAMALSTLVLLTGKPWALLYDGVAALAIGVGIFLGGVLWLGGGIDTQGLLMLVFGYLFAQSGWHSYSMWSDSNTGARPSQSLHAYDADFERKYDRVRDAPPSSSLASQLRNRQSQPPDSDDEQSASADVATVDSSEDVDWSLDEQPASSDESASEPEQTTDDAPASKQSRPPQPPPADDDPSGGFLASFADPDQQEPKNS